MGLMQLLVCNGCGREGPPGAAILKVPDGWQVFDVRRIDEIAPAGVRLQNLVAVCPSCWESPVDLRRLFATADW